MKSKKNILIIICILVFVSCHSQEQKSNNEIIKYEYFSINMHLRNDRVLHLRINEKSDSLYIISQKFNIQSTYSKALKIEPEFKMKFRNITLEHLEHKNVFLNDKWVFEGLDAKFTVGSKGRSVVAQYSNLSSFYQVSYNFDKFFMDLKGDFSVIDSLAN